VLRNTLQQYRYFNTELRHQAGLMSPEFNNIVPENKEINKYCLVNPSLNNSRIINQQGLFLLVGAKRSKEGFYSESNKGYLDIFKKNVCNIQSIKVDLLNNNKGKSFEDSASIEAMFRNIQKVNDIQKKSILIVEDILGLLRTLQFEINNPSLERENQLVDLLNEKIVNSNKMVLKIFKEIRNVNNIIGIINSTNIIANDEIISKINNLLERFNNKKKELESSISSYIHQISNAINPSIDELNFKFYRYAKWGKIKIKTIQFLYMGSKEVVYIINNKESSFYNYLDNVLGINEGFIYPDLEHKIKQLKKNVLKRY
jgi:hypothetical protein